MAKDRFDLPKVTDKSMIHYRDTTFPNSDSGAYEACDYALRHWQRYLNENRCPNHLVASKDISKFCSQLEVLLEPVTIYDIFGQLQRFFDHEKMLDAIERVRYIRDEKLKPKIKKSYYPLRYEQVIELYRAADEEDKVLIRFLLLQKVRIRDVHKIEFIPKEGTFRFVVVNAKTEKRLDVDSETIEVAKIWIKKKNSDRKNPERLFNFNSPRSVAEHIDSLEKVLNSRLLELNKAPLDFPLYAKNIQRYGQKVHQEDLLNWLSVASENKACPTCGRNYSDSLSL